MDLDELPIIDWEQATKLAGNKISVAEEMLGMLIEGLPTDVTAITHYAKDQNHTDLLKRVHKLHGAICYCGLPRLKTVIARLETDLKNNIMVSLPALLDQLNTEVKLLLEHYSCLER